MPLPLCNNDNSSTAERSNYNEVRGNDYDSRIASDSDFLSLQNQDGNTARSMITQESGWYSTSIRRTTRRLHDTGKSFTAFQAEFDEAASR